MSPEMITAFSTVLVPLCSLAAAIISAVYANRANHNATKTRFEKRDSSQEVAARIEHLEDGMKSQGHQLGEIRKDMQSVRNDLSTLIANEVLK